MDSYFLRSEWGWHEGPGGRKERNNIFLEIIIFYFLFKNVTKIELIRKKLYLYVP